MSSSYEGRGNPQSDASPSVPHNSVRPIPPEAVWSALLEDTGCSIYEINGDGHVLWSNDRAEALHGAGRLAGRPPREFLLPGVATEWTTVARDVMQTGRTATLETAIRGKSVHITMRALESPPAARILVVSSTMQPVRGDKTPEIRVVRGELRDLGPMNSLTRREREILGFIADGLTSGEIAKALSRSVKTVEWHRVSIGQKLGVKTRVELAEMARAAGLHGAATSPPGLAP